MFRPLIGFVYDKRAGRFRGIDGRFVAQTTIDELIQRRIDETSRRLYTYFLAVRNGSMSLADFRLLARIEIRNLSLQLLMLAKGGKDAVTNGDYIKAREYLIREYQYLEGLLEVILEISEREAQRRFNMYGSHAREMYWTGRTSVMIEAGFTQERRVLHPAEHCNDCIELAGRGWQPIGTLPEPGDGSTECLSNDKCTKEYK